VKRLAAALICLLYPLAARAHENGAVYMNLYAEGDALRLELDLLVPDALAVLGLPRDLPEEQAWSEIEQRSATLGAAVERGLLLSDTSGPCPLDPGIRVVRTPEPNILQVHGLARCRARLEQPSVQCTLLLDLDPKRRAYVALHDEDRLHSVILDAATPSETFDLRPVSAWVHFAVYLREGVRHVSTGFDHLLFLAALLLPAAVERSNGRWRPRERVRDVFFEVATVVSAFTVAHSITLALAALEVAKLPPRAVESAIAFSVLVAALNNVGPFVRIRPWQLAFGFGLVHGFGFAAQLGILGLPPAAKGVALLGFNLGVEAGQLVVAAVCLPLLLGLRKKAFYRVAVLEAPSIAIAWLASVWLVERLFGIPLIS
jgi:HupE/UreJ protein